MERITKEDSLYRVIDKVVPGTKDELIERINGGDQLKVKFGTDPTGRDLHFGHAVNLWAMRGMQERGHKVDLVIGDVTARIGDPAGRNQERPELTAETVDANAALFLRQIQMILLGDPKVFELHRNSTWYGAMSAIDFIDRTLRRTTLAQLTARKDFKDRIDGGHPIHGHELVYQLLQGYDSVHLGTDIAICGDDQLTNELMGRQLQVGAGLRGQDIMTTRLTPGIDGGKKQSKSIGNYIGLSHTPEEQFRRIMSIPDALIQEYLEVYTDLPTSEIAALVATRLAQDPRGLKMDLAKAMLKRYHPEDTIDAAVASYERSASNAAPEDTPVFFAPAHIDLIDFAAQNFGMSKSAFIRLVQGGGVSIDGKKLASSDVADRKLPLEVNHEVIVKYGKNKWAKLIPAQS